MKAGTESTAEFEARINSRLLLKPLPNRSNLSVADAVAMASNSVGPAANSVVALSLDLIDTEAQYQNRLSLDDDHIEDLRKAFELEGQTEPIQVRRKGDRYVVLRGHHRLEAAKRSTGWQSIKAIVVDVDDKEALRRALTGNSARLDETDFERALGFQRARELGFAHSQAELGNLFGLSQVRVSQILEFLKLPDTVITLLRQRPNLFTYRVAKQIRELCEEFPQHLEIVVNGLMRIVDEQADETSVRAWVLQSIQQLTAKSVSRPEARKLTTLSGKEFCSVNLSGKKVVVNAIGDVDPALLEQAVFNALADLSKSMN